MKRNEYGACSSWWDPLGNGACGHCGVRKWRHEAPPLEVVDRMVEFALTPDAMERHARHLKLAGEGDALAGS